MTAEGAPSKPAKDEVVYYPRLRWVRYFWLLGIEAFYHFSKGIRLHDPIHIAMGVLCVVIVAISVRMVMARVPRITLTPQRIRYDTWRGTYEAGWQSLGEFKVGKIIGGITALLLYPDANEAVVRDGKLTIYRFEATPPLPRREGLAALLNKWREQGTRVRSAEAERIRTDAVADATLDYKRGRCWLWWFCGTLYPGLVLIPVFFGRTLGLGAVVAPFILAALVARIRTNIRYPLPKTGK